MNHNAEIKPHIRDIRTVRSISIKELGTVEIKLRYRSKINRKERWERTNAEEETIRRSRIEAKSSICNCKILIWWITFQCLFPLAESLRTCLYVEKTLDFLPPFSSNRHLGSWQEEKLHWKEDVEIGNHHMAHANPIAVATVFEIFI